MSNLTDDITRLAAILVRQHQGESQVDGKAERLRRAAFPTDRDRGLGKVAKACGTSPSVVRAWETTGAKPTTQEGLAWLSFLYDSQPSLAGAIDPDTPGADLAPFDPPETPA